MAWSEIPHRAKALYRSSQKNAQARGIPFELTERDFALLWLVSGGRCALTDLPFTIILIRPKRWRRNPWGASLDRIDNDIGYTPGNCRLVCVCVNLAMNEWGEEVLRRMATALLEQTAVPEEIPKGISQLDRDFGPPAYRVRLSVGGRRHDLGIKHTLWEAKKLLREAQQRLSPGNEGGDGSGIRTPDAVFDHIPS